MGESESRIKELIKKTGKSSDLISEFKEDFKFSRHETIDEFLERKHKYRDIGAYFIVQVIASLENPSTLFPEHNVYAAIYHILGLESDSQELPPLNVVTLNYDRSLEFFLRQNIRYNALDKIEAIAYKKLAKVPIIHAHGSLGDLESVLYGEAVKGDDQESVPYREAVKGTERLMEAAERIKITADKLDDAEDFQKAQSAIADSINIVILGFGYHSRTLSALFAKTDLHTKQVYGTAKGIPKNRRAGILSYFKNAIHLGGKDEDSVSLLRTINAIPAGIIVH